MSGFSYDPYVDVNGYFTLLLPFCPSHIVYKNTDCLQQHKYPKYRRLLDVYASIEECILSNNNDNDLFADHIMNVAKYDEHKMGATST